MTAHSIFTDLETDSREAQIQIRVLFEPGWRDFRYQSPRLLQAKLAEGEAPLEASRAGRERWREASGPILDFSSASESVRIPLPKGKSPILESVEFEVPLRVIPGWQEVRLGFPERGQSVRVEERGLVYTLSRDRGSFDPDGFGVTLRLAVQKAGPRKGLLERLFPKENVAGDEPLDLDSLEYALEDEDGSDIGHVVGFRIPGGGMRAEVLLSAFNRWSGERAKKPLTLVVREPMIIQEGALRFRFGPLVL